MNIFIMLGDLEQFICASFLYEFHIILLTMALLFLFSYLVELVIPDYFHI